MEGVELPFRRHIEQILHLEASESAKVLRRAFRAPIVTRTETRGHRANLVCAYARSVSTTASASDSDDAAFACATTFLTCGRHAGVGGEPRHGAKDGGKTCRVETALLASGASSRAATDQIRRWWTANPNYGIALHCGRSGAGVFDYDQGSLEALAGYGRGELADALMSAGAVQGTRVDGDRGHYMFLMPDDGKEYGNSAGAFTVVGEFRGKNGVIIAAPTPHPDAETKGGDYNQRENRPAGTDAGCATRVSV